MLKGLESNDLQIAQSIIDAKVLSLADQSLDITRGVIVEIGWCTDGRHTPDGAIIVRPVYTGATSDLVGTAPNISINDKSLEELDITISNILNAQAGDFSYAGNNDKDLRGINDAESVFGNSADFVFHINTTTGEYDILTDTVWSEKFNIK